MAATVCAPAGVPLVASIAKHAVTMVALELDRLILPRVVDCLALPSAPLSPHFKPTVLKDCAKLADVRHALDRVTPGRGCNGAERLEILKRQAFSPHRHGTYAIGLTLGGVQTFNYRGERQYSLPGQCHILHPDETHDGSGGTEAGFWYRMLYLDPVLVQRALGGKPLPFVSEPVARFSARRLASFRRLWDLDDEIDELGRIEVVDLALEALLAASGRRIGSARLSMEGLNRVRAMIAADPAKCHRLDTLEKVADLDRWSLARQFRAAFGTSPSRYRTMRQLNIVRRLILSGMPLVEASLRAGFADQSHMSRQFKKAFGLAPGSWASAMMRTRI